jgi:hypothetical protein
MQLEQEIKDATTALPTPSLQPDRQITIYVLAALLANNEPTKKRIVN